MKAAPTLSEIHALFSNGSPGEVWDKAVDIVGHINPAYDFSFAKIAFDDIVRLFRGEYPGYCPIGTLYHDLPHTLDVFLCTVRLMHGVHISGTRLADKEITILMMAALMHDVGYAQRKSEENGTGAQYTQDHVNRGVEFMRHYMAEKHFPPDWASPLELLIQSTNHVLSFSRINFPDEQARLLGQIISSADLVGQMADRTYLEKLLFLYLEFYEARLGNFQSMYSLLCNTCRFYERTRQLLDSELGGIHTRLTFHFKDWFGVECNYYQESMDKNIAYLSKVVSLGETGYLSMLKRGGIVEKTENLIPPENTA